LSELNNWFSIFINTFREEAKKLTDKQRTKISNLDDFFPPCQIFCIEYIGLPHQWILVTHDSNRSDLEIETLKMQTWEAIEKIKPIVEDPKWERKLTEEERSRVWKVENYSELVEGFFIGAIKILERILYLRPPEPGAFSKLMLLGRDFQWMTNRLEMTNPDDLVSKIIEEAKKQSTEEKQDIVQKDTDQKIVAKEDSRVIEHEIAGFGTYFFPPVWIGEYPDYSFNEKVLGRHVWPEKSFDSMYKDKLLVVYNNGYIGLAEDDQQIAYSNLNEIMATGLLLGIPLFAVNNYELSEVTFNPETLDFIMRGLRQRGSIARIFDPQNMFLEHSIRPYISIKKEGILKICEVAEKISRDEEIATCLLLLIESNTCFQYSQYIQSYVLSWTILEKYLNHLWEYALKENKISKNRIKKLTSSEWKINQIIEVLNINGLIDNEKYKLLNELRKKRNNLVHEGESVKKEEAEMCLNLAHRFILERTKFHKLVNRKNFNRFIIKTFNPNEF